MYDRKLAEKAASTSVKYPASSSIASAAIVHDILPASIKDYHSPCDVLFYAYVKQGHIII